MRGLYTWLDVHMAPQPEPAIEFYKRIPWAALEPSESQYDYSIIDRELSKLPPGGSLSFRVVALNPFWSWKDGSNVPTYLMARMPKGFFIPVNGRTPPRLYIPDWNSPEFLDRLEKLLSALGQKYDGDPRISFVDMGLYGTFGEWHTFGIPDFARGAIPYDDSRFNSRGAEPGTWATRKRIVDAHANAFKKTRLVMMTDDKQALVYALRLSREVQIGMRRDSFGSNHFSREFVDNSMQPSDRDLVLNRWRTAPLVTESFGPPEAFQAGPAGLAGQVEKYHIAAIGNGGFGPWSDLPTEDRDAVLIAGRRSGYRFSVMEATLPAEMNGRTEIPLRTRWMNQGVTPSYESWTVEFTLWSDKGSPVAQTTSTLNLRTLLPAVQPTEIVDVLKTSKKLAKGRYDLRVKVTDPRAYRLPMRLAIEGITPDGGYSLGSVYVN